MNESVPAADGEQLSAPPDKLDTTALQQAMGAPVPVETDIDISFFSHGSRKSTQLIGNESEDNFIKARRDWLSFEFNDIIYVTSIAVYATGYETFHGLDLSYVDYFHADTRIETAQYNGEFFNFEPRRFLGGFGLNPKEPLFKVAKLTKIVVKGIEQKYFSDVVRILDDVTAERERIEASLNAYMAKAKQSYAELEKNRVEISEQNEILEQNNQKIKSLKIDADALSKENDESRTRIEIAASVESEQNQRIETVKTSIDTLNSERHKIRMEISDASIMLKALKDNINLFPTEIAGYVKQGTHNIALYTIFSAVPLAIIGAVTYRLFSNSERLLDFFIASPNVGIIDFLISRTPYVVVSATVLGVCYSILRRLISEVIDINRRRQDLFKISIIATDVSYASQDDLSLTPEARYELRTQTKMEMLKEHLKMHIGEDFTYAPNQNYLNKLNSFLPGARLAATDKDTAKNG